MPTKRCTISGWAATRKAKGTRPAKSMGQEERKNEGAAEEKAFQEGRKKYKTYKKKKQVRKRAAQKK